MDKKILDKIILMSLGIVILILSYFVLKPILAILFLSFILAYSFFPIYSFLFKKTKSKSFSAFLVTFLILMIIFLPVFFITPNLAKEVKNIYSASKEINISSGIESIFPSKFSKDTLGMIDSQFNNFTNKLFGGLADLFENFVYTKLPFVLVGLIIFLFLFYYIIQNLEEISQELLNLIPLKKEAAEKFSYEFKNVTEGVIYGQVFLGIVQGLLMGLFLYVIHFENVLFFTTIGIIAGILPLVGPSLVWVPVSIILLTKGQFFLAIILAIYGLIVSWFIDGFMRPYIISERTVLSLPLSFVGMVGGAYAFGVLGIIIGPLVISYLILIINFYKEGKVSEILRE